MNGNGHETPEPLVDVSPPLILRWLAGVDELPGNEMSEIRLGLATSQELEHDALAELVKLPLDTATAELLEQLAIANFVRAFYVERLENLMERLSRGDETAWRQVLGAAWKSIWE